MKTYYVLTERREGGKWTLINDATEHKSLRAAKKKMAEQLAYLSGIEFFLERGELRVSITDEADIQIDSKECGRGLSARRKAFAFVTTTLLIAVFMMAILLALAILFSVVFFAAAMVAISIVLHGKKQKVAV